jgi:CRP-like cAMP-binding protein
MLIPGAGRSQHVAVSLLRDGPWASLPEETVKLLAAGGKLSEISAGATVYTEAEAERLAVVIRGLLRVYMHTSDGRQVTVRYVRAGGLLGAHPRSPQDESRALVPHGVTKVTATDDLL